jgi:hypothetical protein
MDKPIASMEIEEHGKDLMVRTFRYKEDEIENLGYVQEEMSEGFREFFRILSLVPVEGLGAEQEDLEELKFTLREDPMARKGRGAEKPNGYKKRIVIDIEEDQIDEEENSVNWVEKECSLCGENSHWVTEGSDFICQEHDMDEVSERMKDDMSDSTQMAKEL